MKKDYYKKEYIILYLSKFCFAFANSLIDTFGVVMLYKNGMPLSQILFIYGIRFFIMGLLSPLFMIVSSKFGIALCVLIANLLRVAGSFIILNGNYTNILLFIIVMSLPGALTNPMDDEISNTYIDDSYRGRYNSLRNIFRIIGQMLANILIGYGVLTNNNLLLTSVILIVFIIEYLLILLINYKPKRKNKNVFKETLSYVLKNKSDYKKIYSFRTNHIIERLFVPLYIFLILKDFKTFTIVVTFSLILQMITLFVIGKFTDKNIIKSNKFVSIIRVIITSVYLLFKNKILISVNKTISDNFEKVYETSIHTSIQNIIKKMDLDSSFLATVGQMSLCFTETIVLIVLSLISTIIQEKIFTIIFILSIISTIYINKKTNKVLSINK